MGTNFPFILDAITSFRSIVESHPMSKPAPHKKERPTLTGSVRGDILFLSSLLHRKQAIGQPAGPKERTSEGCNDADNDDNDNETPEIERSLLAYVCNILILGGQDSPLAHDVHAVCGRIESQVIECLVFSKNTPVLTSTSSVPALEEPQHGTLKQIDDVENAERGRLLLDHWGDKEKSEYWKESYTLEEHLRDVFQALSHVAVTEESSSPFDQLAQVVIAETFPLISTPYKSNVKLQKGDLQILNRFQFPGFNGNLELGDLPPGEYTLCVKSQNIGKWLKGFGKLLHFLQTVYPLPADVKKLPGGSKWDPPEPRKVGTLVSCLLCLIRLQPALTFILNVDGMENALNEIESPSKPGTGGGDKYLQQLQIPADLKIKLRFPTERHDFNNLLLGDGDGEDGIVDIADCDAEDPVEDLTEEDEGEDADYPDESQTPATRLLKSVYAITSWMQAADALSTRARTLVGREFKVQMYCCPPVPPVKANGCLKQRILRCFPDLKPQDSKKLPNAGIGKILSRFNNATIHAEAALMGWIMKDHHALWNAQTADVPIAVSKKCCFLCWLLHRLLNAECETKFILSSTHHQIFAWVPPSGTPLPILIQLREALLKVAQQYSSAHSAQSSAESAILDRFHASTSKKLDRDAALAADLKDFED
ncbi:hypothetical protein D9757_002985 [Collybiopsis confluens]|uniref:Uncharacterized protein n=1 Tax=Collybiopsis confluens TaxID=2823264 RepID=A0A8H5MD86_9AGAR|nr:hypothetical protein D9757_002985 [Collybiopsis confluens]